MDKKEDVIKYFDSTYIDYRVLWMNAGNRSMHFGYYDNEVKSHDAALLSMNKTLAQAAGVTRSDRVLDAGCGYGESALWLAEKIGCVVTGITLVPLQAQKGKRIVKERRREDKVKIIEGDFTNLPFPDSSFSVYWALESIVHATDRIKVFQEAFRVLSPGGRIVMAEYTLREKPKLTESESSYLKPWLAGWAMPSLHSPSYYINALTSIGFADVQITDISSRVAPSLRRLEILSWLMYPIALIIAPIFFKPERLKNYYASCRQIQAFKKGLWRYSLITARKAG